MSPYIDDVNGVRVCLSVCPTTYVIIIIIIIIMVCPQWNVGDVHKYEQ